MNRLVLLTVILFGMTACGGPDVDTASPDAAAIDARIDAQAALFEALVLLRVDITLQIRDVLTDNQFALIGHLAPVLRDRVAGWGGDL